MPRYYAIKCYGIGPFPAFYDSFKTIATARRWARMYLSDGGHTVEILRDKPRKPGLIGVEREIVETVQA